MNATKIQIAEAINVLRDLNGFDRLASWKAKDLSKETLEQLLEDAIEDFQDRAGEDLWHTTVLPPLTEELDFLAPESGLLVLVALEAYDEFVASQEPTTELTKTCKRCGGEFPLSSYLKDSKRKDGLFHLHGSRKDGCVMEYYRDLKALKTLGQV